MKTLKNLLFVTVALISTAAFAQVDDDTTLTISVAESFDITVTGAPTINMNTPAHFTDGNSTEMSDHLTITATGDFKVTVETDNANFQDGSGDSGISVGNVEITTTLPNPASDVPLSTTAADLNSTSSGVIGESYDVTYAIPSGNADQFIGVEDDLTTTVTYTVVPQ